MFDLSDDRHVLDTVVRLMHTTATKTGFTTTVRVMARAYETRRKATKAIADAMNIQFDGVLPMWNYIAVRQTLG